ncbi:sulfite exporter TauE/SafE family protein [Hahella sp. KA22]|uniref:sulfite exporter TauE/SafE family protein n=1 Tax=Hahella sp. KA22 TaxID=1628392 RepID=UPI000FDD7513|nr:sulfite exporter TauE/SafE family protein [Hahella sp. KA22]AZZ95205.1 sulfite exporter TauE/SafE family protein [Hahella sp. KA22]QAY52850.1 sulfite exporter TauE/SafE family protein [Hahella sp. KA22]
MTLLDPSILAFLAAVALFTGFVKAGVPALGGLISAAMALVFPPKDALGITLLYLLAGDVVAVSLYWRQAHWGELGKMLPSIFIGIGLGALALQFLDNESLGPVIGALILFLVAMEPLRPYITTWAMRRLTAVRYSSGIMAGIATTIGNAAGPILTLYFLLLKIDKHGFIGTAAVFFLIVNLTKVPVYAYLGVLKDYYLLSYLATVPLVLLGAYAGRRFLVWIPQQWFNRIALIMTGVAGLWLLLRAL